MAPDAPDQVHTTGRILHAPSFYDLFVAVLSLGQERQYRQRLIELAGLAAGESVLDAGCGTGTLAIAAKRRAGPTGRVCGIDPSPEMIRSAKQKARKAAVDVAFEIAAAEELPFSSGTFDVVLSTAMLHHLAADARSRCVAEFRRVLRPGGRLLAVDFGGSAGSKLSCARFAARRNHYDLGAQVVPLLLEAGFTVASSGIVRMGIVDWQFVLAMLSARDRT